MKYILCAIFYFYVNFFTFMIERIEYIQEIRPETFRSVLLKLSRKWKGLLV